MRAYVPRCIGGYVSVALLAITMGCAAARTASSPAPVASTASAGININTYTTTVQQVIATWKTGPQQLARNLIAKYGLPDEATPSRLIWFNNGQWKRTEILNEEIPHQFPLPHQDMLVQTVSYQPPAARLDELARYNGSVVADRTVGELSAHCDSEQANFLSINLAHELIMGRRTVEEARDVHAEALREQQYPQYQQGFLFQVARGERGDPDAEVLSGMGPTAARTAETPVGR